MDEKAACKHLQAALVCMAIASVLLAGHLLLAATLKRLLGLATVTLFQFGIGHFYQIQ